MFKAVIPAAMVASIALAPAFAQQGPAPAERADSLFTIRPAQLAAIGVGVLGGVVVGEVILASEMGVLVGGVLGGVLGHMWYGGRQLELVTAPTPRS
jgi:hypothetical protein